MSGWGVTNLRDPQLESRDDSVEVRVEPGDVIDSSDAIFWIAPQIYRGNKVGVSVVVVVGAAIVGVVGVRTPQKCQCGCPTPSFSAAPFISLT